MAKYQVKFSCGHEGEVELFGKSGERHRRIDWLERQGSCPECYRQQRKEERDAAGPTVHVRRISAYDPRRAHDHRMAEAILAGIAVDRLEEMEQAGELTSNGPDTPRDLAAARKKVQDLEISARNALHQPARAAAVELAVTNSYSVKDLLKGRGYAFQRDAVSPQGAALSLRAEPAWVKTFKAEEALAAEITWIEAQGWRFQEHTDPMSAIVEALVTGRSDLVPVVAGDTDPLTAAKADRERAKQERQQARELATARRKKVQEDLAKAATFQVGDRPDSVLLEGDRITAHSRDGRSASGWVLDGDWVITQVGHLDLPAGSAEGERIGRDAHDHWLSLRGDE